MSPFEQARKSKGLARELNILKMILIQKKCQGPSIKSCYGRSPPHQAFRSPNPIKSYILASYYNLEDHAKLENGIKAVF